MALLLIVSAVILFYIQSTFAECECGYAVNDSTTGSYEVFTDLLESNFLTIQDIALDTDWRIQKYHIPPRQGHIGRKCTAGNVISNPLASNHSYDGPGMYGQIPGLQLWVRGGMPESGLVPSGEVRSTRNDILYGSFRIAARLTDVNGTCSAIFSYYNDTQEIDIELLSRQYGRQTGSSDSSSSSDPDSSSFKAPLNLVLHSAAAQAAGFQIPNTSTYGQPVVPVDVSGGFHEYRFDWMPGVVNFFFDGIWLWTLIDANVPRSPSALLLSHWSNGAHGWSQGPPSCDAVMTVSYVKAYFNSTDPLRQRDYERRCHDQAAQGAVCVVPSLQGAPNASDPNKADAAATLPRPASAQGAQGANTAKTFFFSEQRNQTYNQTVYTGINVAGRLCVRRWLGWLLSAFSIAVLVA